MTKHLPDRSFGCGRSISSPPHRCRIWSGEHIRQHGDIRTLADKAAIQLNDTHPAIAVAELMRILVDLHEIPWDDAWRITTDTISYTNHTLLPEALESWPVSLMDRLLPRHMQIVYQINRLHLDAVCAVPRDEGPPLIAALSLIDDNAGRRVRMSSLAFLGSHKVNGVSELHTELHAPDRIPRAAQSVSGSDRQQNQWYHVASLAVCSGKSTADQPADRGGRRTCAGRFGTLWRISPSAWRTTPRCTNACAPFGEPTSRRWRGWWRTSLMCAWIRMRCAFDGNAYQAHPRV